MGPLPPIRRGKAIRGHRLRSRAMTIGIAILLIAVGAILRYAVTVSVEGVELDTVGLILMIAGIIGLIIALAVMFIGNDRRSADDYPTRRY
jgi:hypothetical protein